MDKYQKAEKLATSSLGASEEDYRDYKTTYRHQQRAHSETPVERAAFIQPILHITGAMVFWLLSGTEQARARLNGIALDN